MTKALYERVAEVARQEGRPVAHVIADLIGDGLTLHEWITGMDAQLRETRRDVRRVLELLEGEKR